MIRLRYALLLALLLLIGWLLRVGYRARWQAPGTVVLLADAATRNGLPGLAAQGYLYGAEADRSTLLRLPSSGHPAAKTLTRSIIRRRLDTARLLLESGYPHAAERLALEAARADYDDLEARALLLTIRLRGQRREQAQQDLLALLVRGESAPLLVLLARSFMQADMMAEAEATLRRALALDPHDFDATLALADLAARNRDRKAARQWLARAWPLARQTWQQRALLAREKTLEPALTYRTHVAALWWQAHNWSVGVAVLYVLLLLSPTWLRLFT